MSEENQDVEAIFREWQRRLQKIKEKEAKLGINTPVEILNEIEDIQNILEELEQTRGVDDPFLALILAIGIISVDYVSITLTINGVVVSGLVIGAKQYGEYLFNSLMTSEDGKIGVNSKTVDHSNKYFLHLRDARLYPTSDGPIPPLDEPGMYWKGKLSEIESYAIKVIK